MTLYLILASEPWADIPRARGTFDVKATTDLSVVNDAIRQGVMVLRIAGERVGMAVPGSVQWIDDAKTTHHD